MCDPMVKENVIVSIGLITLAVDIVGTLDTQSANAGFFDDIIPGRKAPIVSGDNTYIAWWANSTGNDEVMFRV